MQYKISHVKMLRPVALFGDCWL